MNNKLQTITNLFEEKEIRSFWDSEKEEYYFSVIDVIGALTDNDYDKSRNYWKWLKNKLKEEGSELVSNTNQLKLQSLKDGKFYKTDTLDTKGIFRLVESVPSAKAEPFKIWLANLGNERINEVFDPELAINRAVNYYRNKGYSDEWIKKRLNGIVDRFKLTDTDIEIALTNIGEIAARDIAKKEHPQGLNENMKVAARGGRVAKGARDVYEEETKTSAISKENALDYQYKDDNKLIENK